MPRKCCDNTLKIYTYIRYECSKVILSLWSQYFRKRPLCEMCSGVEPTHVVTSITYGGNAHFVFRKVKNKACVVFFKNYGFYAKRAAY